MYWRQGIYLNWSPEAYCLVGSEVLDNHPESFLKITVPSCRKGKEINLNASIVTLKKSKLKNIYVYKQKTFTLKLCDSMRFRQDVELCFQSCRLYSFGPSCGPH